MITEKDLHKLIEDITQHIEYLENNCPDNRNIYKLKLLLGNVSVEEGEIHIKSSLQNKEEAHLFLSNCAVYIANCAVYMDMFENENLYN